MENSILDRFQRTLENIIENSRGEYHGCFFGMPNVSHLDVWNYFVFRRKKSTRAAKGEPVQTNFELNVIHEDYIPEGFIDELIKKLETKDEQGTKLKLCDDDITYSYIQKGNTDIVIEIATIILTHPQKRG